MDLPRLAKFQHTAARRRLETVHYRLIQSRSFNTQPPEGGWGSRREWRRVRFVSTHSRPKAAGRDVVRRESVRRCFNTQPPEGGWGGMENPVVSECVSTHSRPKAAGKNPDSVRGKYRFQHTAARRRLVQAVFLFLGALNVSTHSRPKAAGQTNGAKS